MKHEASAALKSYLTENYVGYQLVPLYFNRRNAAERTIKTFKEHFVAIIASADPYFPLNLWDRLLPQAEMTLHLLRTSMQHPKLSAAAHYHGMIDFNKTDFAPPGCKIIVHGNRHNDELGYLMASMATHWVLKYNITDVKMFTFHPRLAKESLTLWSSFLTILQCRRFPPWTDYSWLQMT
jgi:hypothetical protein